MNEILPSINRQTVSLGEHVYRTIKDAILNGDLAPGQRLTEADLTESLDVSRSPLREALARLKQEGLIQGTPHRGITVAGISRREQLEAAQVRECLEPYAVRLAIHSIPADELDKVQQELQAAEQEILEGSFETHIRTNEAVHSLITRYSGNSLIADLIARFDERFNRYLAVKGFSRGNILASYEEHLDILQALRARDADLAAELLRTHVRQSAERTALLFEDEGIGEGAQIQ